MKRIAILVPGGIGNANQKKNIPPLANLIDRLSDNFDITVYSFTKVELTSNGVKVAIRSTSCRIHDSIIKRILFLTFAVLKDYRRKRFQIFHGVWAFPSGFVAVILAKLLVAKSVISVLGGEVASVPQIGYGNMLHPVLRKITLWSCEKCDVLTTLTKFQVDELRRFSFKRKQVEIIPFGAEKEKFKYSRIHLTPPIQFLHVANLTEVKDQKTLLLAFKKISRKMNAQLWIIGPDYLNGEIQAYAKELSITNQVQFLGYVLHERLPEYYAKSHIMLHTSFFEGQGVVFAEAAASGVVVCGTQVGLIADLGEDCAISFQVGQYQELAEKVIDLLQDKKRFEELRSNAKYWADKHDMDWTVSQYVQLYEKTLKVNH